jgi:hypothetical protein
MNASDPIKLFAQNLLASGSRPHMKLLAREGKKPL